MLFDPRAVYCSKRCRQTAWRARRGRALAETWSRPIRVAYADPPYMGLAGRYYRNEPTFAGEVDHGALLERLRVDAFDGWALSASAESLQVLLPMCPVGVRVCPWVKPHGVPEATRGIHNAWEPVIVWGGRQRPPGVRDWLSALPARGGGDLMGRKPLRFCCWLFDLLGMQAGDELVDIFPGTGVVSRAWAEVSRGARGDARRYLSRSADDDTSARAPGDASPMTRGDGCGVEDQRREGPREVDAL